MYFFSSLSFLVCLCSLVATVTLNSICWMENRIVCCSYRFWRYDAENGSKVFCFAMIGDWNEATNLFFICCSSIFGQIFSISLLSNLEKCCGLLLLTKILSRIFLEWFKTFFLVTEKSAGWFDSNRVDISVSVRAHEFVDFVPVVSLSMFDSFLLLSLLSSFIWRHLFLTISFVIVSLTRLLYLILCWQSDMSFSEWD